MEKDISKIKFSNNPIKLQSELKELNKIQVVYKNLHEIKRKMLVEYTCELEMVGNLKVGDQVRQTHLRCRIIDDHESYINAIDNDLMRKMLFLLVIFINYAVLN